MKNYPKIGIRPTIDGRQGGVRESLEKKTMSLAHAVAELITANLRNPDGSPVECVIADGTIGRVAETAACQAKFEREGVGATISVTSCWCYGSETMDMHPHWPKAVWGFNGTERPGAVYLAAVLAANAQKGLPAFGIYGHDVQDLDDNTVPADVAEKILRWARAAQAVALMRGKSYLQIGSQCMGIAGSIMDQDMMETYFGMRVESVDEVEILRRMEEGIYNEEEFQKALAWTKEHCKEGRDDNPESVNFLGEERRIKFTPEEKEKQWEFTVKMYCIIKDLMAGNKNLPDQFEEEKVGHNAIAGGFQGQRQWTDHWPNCDYPEALLSSTFDYEGAREPFTLATENDILNGMGMLMMRLLTHRAQIFADVRTYWSGEATERVTGYKLEGKAAQSNGIIHLLNSGAACLDASGVCTDENGNATMKKWWEVTEEDIKKMTDATVWCEAGFDNFRGGGFSSHYTTKAEMPCTMIRLNLVKGLGPVLQIAEGWSTTLDAKQQETLMLRTNPEWPCTWFTPRLTGKGFFKDVYSVMNAWAANHGAIAYGHIGADLITLASMLRIPVAMHNVDEEKVFQPHCWGLFGASDDPTGADYRACRNFGPLYATNR